MKELDVTEIRNFYLDKDGVDAFVACGRLFLMIDLHVRIVRTDRHEKMYIDVTEASFGVNVSWRAP